MVNSFGATKKAPYTDAPNRATTAAAPRSFAVILPPFMYFLTLMSFALNRSELFSQQVLYYHTDSQNPGGEGGAQHFHSSKRYSPKSHTAVKKITSNAIRNASQSQRSTGFSANSAAVASVLAISSGVSNGNSSSGSNNSRIRACAEIADSVVPVTESPRLTRNSTNASCGTTPSSGTLYSTAKIGSSSSSVINRKSVLAHSLDRKIANGSETERRNALRVSLVCSRKNPGCSISDAANRNAIHSNPGPNRRDSSRVGSNVKLNSTTTIKMKTTVVVSSSRERNSVRSSLPSSTEVLENKLIRSLYRSHLECGGLAAAVQPEAQAKLLQQQLRVHHEQFGP